MRTRTRWLTPAIAALVGVGISSCAPTSSARTPGDHHHGRAIAAVDRSASPTRPQTVEGTTSTSAPSDTTVPAPCAPANGEAGSAPSPAATSADTSTAASVPPTAWPTRLIVPAADLNENDGFAPVDLGDHVAFLASTSSGGAGALGPNRLELVDVDTGRITRGPVLSGDQLAFAGGYLWVFGFDNENDRVLSPGLCQIDPDTLGLVRQWPFPVGPLGPPPVAGVADGPAGSVWIATLTALIRVDPADGRTLARVPAGPGSVVDIATDPADLHLYVSMSASLHTTIGSHATSVDQVVERDAATGRLLAATTASSPVTDGVSGPSLTATPTTVWASFRTGMAGATVILRQKDLSPVTPPRSGPGPEPPGGEAVFEWFQGAYDLYADGTMWDDDESGVWACLDPGTGGVRAHQQQPGQGGLAVSGALLGVSSWSRQLVVDGRAGLEVVTVPAACFR